MNVVSKKSIHFPGLNWGIRAGETRALPKDKEAREEILAHPAIEKVSEASNEKGGKKLQEND